MKTKKTEPPSAWTNTDPLTDDEIARIREKVLKLKANAQATVNVFGDSRLSNDGKIGMLQDTDPSKPIGKDDVQAATDQHYSNTVNTPCVQNALETLKKCEDTLLKLDESPNHFGFDEIRGVRIPFQVLTANPFAKTIPMTYYEKQKQTI